MGKEVQGAEASVQQSMQLLPEEGAVLLCVRASASMMMKHAIEPTFAQTLERRREQIRPLSKQRIHLDTYRVSGQLLTQMLRGSTSPCSSALAGHRGRFPGREGRRGAAT